MSNHCYLLFFFSFRFICIQKMLKRCFSVNYNRPFPWESHNHIRLQTPFFCCDGNLFLEIAIFRQPNKFNDSV